MLDGIRFLGLSSVLMCLALSQAGCSKEEMAAKNLERASIERLKNTLKDPDSAKFQNVRVIDQKGGAQVVCGEVNAKNSFGGYTGFQDFYVSLNGVEIIEDFDADYTNYCISAGYTVEEVKARTEAILADTRRISGASNTP